MLEKIENQITNYSKKLLRVKRWDQIKMHDSVRAMHDRFSPATFDYFFELNPSFHYQYHDLENLSEYPIVMLRDGFLGIFHFFVKFPKPLKGMDTLLLIPKEFSYLVSKFWKEKVLFYTIENTQKVEEIKHTYIFGTLTKDNFLKSNISKTVKKMKTLIPKESKISVVTSVKHHFFLDFRNEIETSMLFQKEMYKEFGFDINFIDEYKIKNFENLDSSCGFIDLDSDKFIISDHYFKHFFSSRGARDLNQVKQQNKNILKTVKLSPYHHINLELSDDKAFEFEILQEVINLKVQSIPIQYLHYEFYKYVKKVFTNLS